MNKYECLNVDSNPFDHAIKLLGGRLRRTVCNNTVISQDGDHLSVRLHGHKIMEIRPDHVILNSCGYRTVTTKDRLNRFLPYSAPRVGQTNYQWFIGDELFQDGHVIRFAPDGTVV